LILTLAAKLVIIAVHQPPVVVPYPSMARCEAARAALYRQSYDPKANTTEAMPGGGYIIHGGRQFEAYCIPG
jgi:hypothetical protein